MRLEEGGKCVCAKLTNWLIQKSIIRGVVTPSMARSGNINPIKFRLKQKERKFPNQMIAECIIFLLFILYISRLTVFV